MILIVGSQRTGSTLMSMILGAHPDLTLKGDVDLPDILSGTCQHGDVIHAVIWTARHSLFREAIPNARYIFMLRDIRAIVSSMLELGTPGLSWAEQFAIPEIARAITGISNWNSQHRVIPYLGSIYHDGDILKAATVCAYLKSYMLREYIRHEMRVYPVRYEALVACPRETLEKVAEFLEVEWSDNFLSHSLFQGDTKEFAGNDPNRPIDAASVYKWRSILTGDKVERIATVVEELDDIFYGFAKNNAIL